MVSSFMRSSGWIRVVQFLQRNMQMAPNDVGRRKRLPGSSAEQESNLAAANKLFEPSGNRRVKIDLTDGIRRLEPLVTNGGGGARLEYATPISFFSVLTKVGETGPSNP